MKKKLIFVCNNLHIGGIQRSLINLLNEISDKYEITLFLFSPIGEYETPKNVHLIFGNRLTRIMGMSHSEASDAGVLCMLWRTLWVILTRIFGSRFTFGILCMFQKLDGEYDAAISFMQNSSYRYFYGGCNEFTVKSIKAKRKISFVHCDFKNYFGNNSYNRSYYKNFDAVACVSDSCREVFEAVCPELKGKTASVHNCFNYAQMRLAAERFDTEYTNGTLNIFTSARISSEKGIFRMLLIFERLKNKGCSFVWRIAGRGAEYESALAESKKRNLSDNIVFLGLQKNPYPYFKSADLVLVPSYDEAAPMVYGEAMTFGIPILTTNTVSAKELVEKNAAGFVCDNSDEAIESTLEALLKNPERVYNSKYQPKGDNKIALKEFDSIIRGKTL